MSFADERDPDPPAGTASASVITVEPVGQGVSVSFTRGGVMLMRVWMASTVARRMEGDLDAVTPLMQAAENAAAYARVVHLFRDVVRSGGTGGAVELPDDLPGQLFLRLLH